MPGVYMSYYIGFVWIVSYLSNQWKKRFITIQAITSVAISLIAVNITVLYMFVFPFTYVYMVPEQFFQELLVVEIGYAVAPDLQPWFARWSDTALDLKRGEVPVIWINNRLLLSPL